MIPRARTRGFALALIVTVAAISDTEASAYGKPSDECGLTGSAANRIAACTNAILSVELLGEDATRAYRLRALAHRDAGEYGRAIADFDEALQRQPKNASILFERAGTFTSLGDYHKAIFDYDRCLAIDPENSRAYFQRGVNHYRLGQHATAVHNYNEALRLDPNYTPAYNERAWTLYLLGDYARALDDTHQALSAKPTMAPALDTRGHVLAALGRIEEGLAAFERAMDAGGRRFIRLYQSALIRHGYYNGTADGTDREGIREALRACLTDHCRLLK